MPSLHDFEHLLIWFQAILFAFPTYLGAKAFLGRERQIYLTLTVVVMTFCILFGALAQHASDEELAQETSARATLQARVEELQETVGRLSGNGAFPVILAGLTTQENAGRLIMRNYTKAPLMGVKVEYTCMPSPISLSESVGTVPPNSVVDLATLLPLNTCRAFAVTSPTTPPMAAWVIRITTQSGEFSESMLFRRGPGCPMWDWTAQVDQLPGIGLKDGKYALVGQDKLLWHTDGWVNQKCNSRSVTGSY